MSDFRSLSQVTVNPKISVKRAASGRRLRRSPSWRPWLRLMRDRATKKMKLLPPLLQLPPLLTPQLPLLLLQPPLMMWLRSMRDRATKLTSTPRAPSQSPTTQLATSPTFTGKPDRSVLANQMHQFPYSSVSHTFLPKWELTIFVLKCQF